jgi:hypothetical protein
LGQQQLQRVILCPAFTIPPKITEIFQKMIFLAGFIVSNIFFCAFSSRWSRFWVKYNLLPAAIG